jgi:hypothetical protein
MTISPNRLVVRPTTERGDTKVSCVEIVNEIPPNSYIVKDENGTLAQVFQDPQYEGQVKVYVDGSLVQMYVVVDVGGTLTWKIAKIVTEFIDPTTGQPFSSL